MTLVGGSPPPGKFQMFRLVLTYHLVVALLVGPMLCCCAAARVGHDGTTSGSAAAITKPARKHCCGEPVPAHDGGHKAPAKKSPEPCKCPCKDGNTKVAAAPDPSHVSAESLTLLASAVTLDDAFAAVVVNVPERLAPRFDHRSSSLSASDLLYAHHNLRC